MKLLADMGVSGSTVRHLRSLGHDVKHLSDEGLERLADTGVVSKAISEGRVILTFDLDFGELLAATHGPFPSVVIMRLRNQVPASVSPRLASVLKECGEELAKGAIVTVEESRYRIHRLPVKG